MNLKQLKYQLPFLCSLSPTEDRTPVGILTLSPLSLLKLCELEEISSTPCPLWGNETKGIKCGRTILKRYPPSL